MSKSYVDVLVERRDEIGGEWAEEHYVQFMQKSLSTSPALEAIALMMRAVPIQHARILYGPQLPNGKGQEHELSVNSPAEVVFGAEISPGRFVEGAGYLTFGFDLDGYPDHFIGPHPESGDLAVLQIPHKKVAVPVERLAPGQYGIVAPTLVEFFTHCTFASMNEYGHPPRK